MRVKGLALLSVWCVVSCGGHEGERVLRIGVNPWPGYELISVAEQQGLFDEAGLPVELVEYSSLTDVLLAFERGHVDAMTCTMIEALLALDQSERRPTAVIVVDASHGADMIFSAASRVPDLAGLRGKKVGVEVRSLGTFMLARALEKAGMTMDDVVVVPSDQLSIERQLVAGEIDAAVAYPPVSERIRATPGFIEIFSTREIPEEVLDAVFVDQSAIDANPEIPAAMLRVWGRVLTWAEQNRDTADRMMAEREALSVEDFREARSSITIFSVEKQAELLRPDGPFDRSLKHADRVLSGLGQYESSLRLDPDPRAYLAVPGEP